MIVPKQTGIGFRAALRATRCLSTTAVRPWATPTSRPSETRNGNPVDDIDLVFDYPSEGQGSYQKQPLETSGLDLHSAMPHHPKAGMQGGTPGSKMENEMGVDSNAMYVSTRFRLSVIHGTCLLMTGNRYRYIGLGALGLGGLYMMMRRQSAASPKMGEPGDLVSQKAADKSMERMLGRGR